MIKKLLLTLIFCTALSSQEVNNLKENEDQNQHNGAGFYFKVSFEDGVFLFKNESSGQESSPSSIAYWDLLLGFRINRNISLFSGLVFIANPNVLMPVSPRPFESPAYELQWIINAGLYYKGEYKLFPGVPLGIAYYFPNQKIFLSCYFAEPNFDLFRLMAGDNKDILLSFKASIQKELYINKNWGLGIGFSLGYVWTNFYSAELQGLMVGIGLTGTFN